MVYVVDTHWIAFADIPCVALDQHARKWVAATEEYRLERSADCKSIEAGTADIQFIKDQSSTYELKGLYNLIFEHNPDNSLGAVYLASTISASNSKALLDPALTDRRLPVCVDNSNSTVAHH